MLLPRKVVPNSATELLERLIVALGLVIKASDVLLPTNATADPLTARGEVADSDIAFGWPPVPFVPAVPLSMPETPSPPAPPAPPVPGTPPALPAVPAVP